MNDDWTFPLIAFLMGALGYALGRAHAYQSIIDVFQSVIQDTIGSSETENKPL